MISVNDNERRAYLAWMGNGEFISQIQSNIIMRQPNRQWDGYIHCSALDWNKSPEQQVKANVIRSNSATIEMYRAARAGDIYHRDIQEILDLQFGADPTKSIKEFEMKVPEWRFSGTLDRMQMDTAIGNILMEFKSEGTYERDKTGGVRLWSKLEKNLDGLKRKLSPDSEGIVATYHLFSDSDVADIQERLMSKPKKIELKSKHVTQVWTYAWQIQEYFKQRIDWVIIPYLRRDTYKIEEFVWYVPHHQDLIYKAYQNFIGVSQCLNTYLQQQNGYSGQPPTSIA